MKCTFLGLRFAAITLAQSGPHGIGKFSTPGDGPSCAPVKITVGSTAACSTDPALSRHTIYMPGDVPVEIKISV